MYSKYPDVLSRLPTLLKEGVSSCVLDCEAVAFDAANGKLLPFQVGARPARGHAPVAGRVTTVAWWVRRCCRAASVRARVRRTCACRSACSCSTCCTSTAPRWWAARWRTAASCCGNTSAPSPVTAPSAPTPRRRARLHAAAHSTIYTLAGTWQFATSKDCSTIEEVQLFLEEAVKESCEGLMVKMLTGDNSKYDIARRSHNWLKV